MIRPELSIIIPVYNEAETITTLLEAVILIPFSLQILVVDDGSTDHTASQLSQFVAQHPNVSCQVFRHALNLGKGAAIRTAQPHVTGEVVVIQDADLEYDPAELPRLVLPVIEGKADVVYGSRLASGGKVGWTYTSHYVGNRLLTWWSNLFSGLDLSDMETCYKIVKANLFCAITIQENRFGFEPEITQKLAKIPGIRLVEMPINYYGRTYKEGKKMKWVHGFRALWCVLRYRFKV